MEDGVAVADLLDLETELQSLEQGFNQLQNIPSMPEDDQFNGIQWSVNGAPISDPFGDSFFNATNNSEYNNGLSAALFAGNTPIHINGEINTQWAAVTPILGVSNVFQSPVDSSGLNSILGAINNSQSGGLLLGSAPSNGQSFMSQQQNSYSVNKNILKFFFSFKLFKLVYGFFKYNNFLSSLK